MMAVCWYGLNILAFLVKPRSHEADLPAGSKLATDELALTLRVTTLLQVAAGSWRGVY